MTIDILHIDTTELADINPRTYDSTRHLYTATDGCPCDACPNRSRCRDQEESCKTFNLWCQAKEADGQSREPSGTIYRRMWEVA